MPHATAEPHVTRPYDLQPAPPAGNAYRLTSIHVRASSSTTNTVESAVLVQADFEKDNKYLMSQWHARNLRL